MTEQEAKAIAKAVLDPIGYITWTDQCSDETFAEITESIARALQDAFDAGYMAARDHYDV